MGFNPCCCGWNAEALGPVRFGTPIRQVSILVVVDGTLKLVCVLIRYGGGR